MHIELLRLLKWFNYFDFASVALFFFQKTFRVCCNHNQNHYMPIVIKTYKGKKSQPTLLLV